MKTLLTIIFFLLFTQCYVQTKHQKLIVAEYRVDNPKVGNYTYLVSYNFNDGVFTSKDTIFSAETNRKGVAGSYVRYDLGKNFIYKNRYVISGIGNVIDIKKKALVIEESDDFVVATGDSLFFHRNNIFSGTGFLILNLITGKYNFIDNKDWDRDKEKRTSPDKKHYLSIDQAKIPYKVCLHNSYGKKKTIVDDAGHGPNIMYSSQFPTIETHWLDNNTFLYAVHEIKINAAQKDFSKVTLHLFDINKNSNKVFFVLDSVSNGRVNGRFFKDDIGQTIYRTSGWSHYIVDTVKGVLVDYPFYELGFNFSTANKSEKDGTVINYNKSEIGKLWCSNGVVSDGMIAVEYGDIGSNLAYPRGIKVWSNLTKSWSTINIPWLSNVIGWVDKE